MAKKKLSLTPDAFRVNEQGEVVINSRQLAEVMKDTADEQGTGEQGITISLEISSRE